jgi:hypothetical protein
MVDPLKPVKRAEECRGKGWVSGQDSGLFSFFDFTDIMRERHSKILRWFAFFVGVAVSSISQSNNVSTAALRGPLLVRLTLKKTNYKENIVAV